MIRLIRCTLLAVALWPAIAFAQAPATATQYPDWDQLTQTQRDALVAPLRERWNSNPGERTRMLARAQRWKTMPRDQRDRARHGMQRWEHMSPGQRGDARALFHAMRGMDNDERKAFLAEWRQKNQQQKAEWLKAHPAPERREQH